jgi:hypothetical protein
MKKYESQQQKYFREHYKPHVSLFYVLHFVKEDFVKNMHLVHTEKNNSYFALQ